MEVYKFGGASVKDAEGVKNLAKIIDSNKDKQLLIVVSAMGKITNALEKLTFAYINKLDTTELFDSVKAYHEEILSNLFDNHKHPVFDDVANTFVEIDWILEEDPHEDHDFIYDQIVSVGELASSKIVSAYLNLVGLSSKWLDARNFVQTDNTYREAKVNWDKTKSVICDKVAPILTSQFAITQGFIGGTSENFTTTLGREGSDYSAAIFASCLGAELVTIWKDVPGVLNADPKFFPNTVKYDELSYTEAMEMTYYGATVIHPKTIKPLQNANIPLLVKSFLSPQIDGTIIHSTVKTAIQTPAIIIKNNQVLVSLFTKDHSFITEMHLSEIFKAFADINIKINMMQISALSFSVCIDEDESRFKQLSRAIDPVFSIRFNSGLKLITIRHYKKDTLDKLSEGKVILLEQVSRNTAQLVVKESIE